MKNTFNVPLVAFLFLVPCLTTHAQQKAHDSSRWEKAIADFESQDKTNPPPKGGLVFIGSSTIARWKTLAQDFPEHKLEGTI
jgi:hypothetical protein